MAQAAAETETENGDAKWKLHFLQSGKTIPDEYRRINGRDASIDDVVEGEAKRERGQVLHYMAVLVEDPAKKYDMLRRSSLMGNVSSMVDFAWCNQEGYGNGNASAELALAWLERAASFEVR